MPYFDLQHACARFRNLYYGESGVIKLTEVVLLLTEPHGSNCSSASTADDVELTNARQLSHERIEIG